ncbi:acetylxylan esterase [Opitutus sp. ER46]|uniref:acetylxylan esterase n=1 Tax=Opitutus sp. ER46 TaxID=2161864 RepID=UPI000D2FBAC0|nr:acetylxylan esterase [Opitutus sp. ER46]PTX91401.1 acetylxylan esterase [Opitutus sp. ER46]
MKNPRPLFASIVALALPALLPAATPVAITPVPPGVELRVAAVQVRVAPDHRDWTYRLGETAKFKVTVVADNEPIEGASITYTAGQETRPTEEKTATVPPEGLVIDGGTLQAPGFLRCTVKAEIAGRTWRGVATAAFEPEKIKPTQTEPEDFDAFWTQGREALAKVPLEARMTLLPEACTDTVNVYHVSFRTVGESWTPQARVYGIYCEPKKAGKYPALLRVPGAGVRPYAGDPGTAAQGAITLEIGIHGIPVNLAKEVYDSLYGSALKGYWLYNLDDRESYYYRRVYLSCLRANDFLTSRDNWDGRTLVVTGASQGGQLSIVTAALDPRVTALVVTHPAGCDQTGDLHGRAGGWPRPFQQWNYPAPSPHATPAKIATTAYYDTVNFARRLKVPGYYNWGYNDDVCPPTSMFAAYNVITAPKKLGLTLELAHSYTPEQGAENQDRVVTFLGLK